MSPAKLIAMFLRRLFSIEQRADYNKHRQDESKAPRTALR
jgi:hypothetical protein